MAKLGDGTTTRPTSVDVVVDKRGQCDFRRWVSYFVLYYERGYQVLGGNGYANLRGTTTERHTPVVVYWVDSGVKCSGPGRLHTCALTTEAAPRVGYKTQRLNWANGTTTQRLMPVDVVGLGGGSGTNSTYR